MTDLKIIARIPIDQLEWQTNGSDDDPRGALLTHIQIGPVDMHLEAWEVENDMMGEQIATGASGRGAILDQLITMMDGAFQTAEIEGRHYVLVATPYGR